MPYATALPRETPHHLPIPAEIHEPCIDPEYVERPQPVSEPNPHERHPVAWC